GNDQLPIAYSSRPMEAIRLEERSLFVQNAAEATRHEYLKEKVEAHFADGKLETAEYLKAKKLLTEAMMDKIDFGMLRALPDEVKKQRVREAVQQILTHDIQIPLTAAQTDLLKDQAVDDLLGF